MLACQAGERKGGLTSSWVPTLFAFTGRKTHILQKAAQRRPSNLPFVRFLQNCIQPCSASMHLGVHTRKQAPLSCKATRPPAPSLLRHKLAVGRTLSSARRYSEGVPTQTGVCKWSKCVTCSGSDSAPEKFGSQEGFWNPKSFKNLKETTPSTALRPTGSAAVTLCCRVTMGAPVNAGVRGRVEESEEARVAQHYL